MNIIETINQIKSQLKEIELQEQANQLKQAEVSQRILELEAELQQKNQQRDRLDRDALRLYTEAEELRPKLGKLERIANLSKEFLELHSECQDNQDLLNTLYSSVSNTPAENKEPTSINIHTDKPVSPSKSFSEDTLINYQDNTDDRIENRHNYADYSITIDDIKEALPNAEKIYQQLVASYLEEYKTYQNYIIDGLDLIWYAVAFIAFGRPSYRKMGFKYHPDLDGSDMAMQLINTAWSISQHFKGDEEREDAML